MTQISAFVSGWTLQTFSQGEAGAAAAGGAGAAPGAGAGASWANPSAGAMHNANAAPRDRNAN
jgi:hypothetical protein